MFSCNQLSRNPLVMSLIGLLSLVFMGCSGSLQESKLSLNEARVVYAAKPSQWKKREWTYRTAKLLRAGVPLEGEEFEKLVAMSEPEIIDQLMQDSRFADAVLDFNMYFIGVKTDSLRDQNDQYISANFGDLSDYPTAIESALNVMKDGDYLALMQRKAPMYRLPLPAFRTEIFKKTRAELIAEFSANYEKLIAEAEANPTQDFTEFCMKHGNEISPRTAFPTFVVPIGPLFWAILGPPILSMCRRLVAMSLAARRKRGWPPG